MLSCNKIAQLHAVLQSNCLRPLQTRWMINPETLDWIQCRTQQHFGARVPNTQTLIIQNLFYLPVPDPATLECQSARHSSARPFDTQLDSVRPTRHPTVTKSLIQDRVSARPQDTQVPECQHWSTLPKTLKCQSASTQQLEGPNRSTFLCQSASTETLNWKQQSARVPALKHSNASTETLKCQHWNTKVPALEHSSASRETFKCRHWNENPRARAPILQIKTS